MASVYIIYSESADKFYVGSCADLNLRLKQHNAKAFKNSYTSIATDWKYYFFIENLAENSARKIEQHIKKMKSRTYFENLKTFPEIAAKLVERYS